MAFTIVYYVFQILRLYQWLMIIWVFSSWLPQTREIGVIRLIGRLVEPYLNIFRRLIPSIGGMDFSAIIAFVMYNWGVSSLLQIVVRFLI